MSTNSKDLVERLVAEVMRHGDRRSAVYHLGMIDLLRRRMYGYPMPRRYEAGSVEFDAYHAGVDHGKHVWRDKLGRVEAA